MALDGSRFTDGIDFTFPAGTTLAVGARICVAADPACFDLRYGAGIPRIGPFIGSLDNAGERIRIVDAVGEEILDFTYSPAWFPASAMAGYALAVLDDTTTSYDAWTQPATWGLSAAPGGAPGQAPILFSQQYAGWKNYVFTEAERANPAISGAGVVINPAGLGNALCFALGLNPHSADISALPEAVLVNVAGQNYAALRFRRWKSAIGTTYALESANVLGIPGAWTQDSVVVETVDNGDSTETVTLRSTTAGAPRYLRLKVTVE